METNENKRETKGNKGKRRETKGNKRKHKKTKKTQVWRKVAQALTQDMA